MPLFLACLVCRSMEASLIVLSSHPLSLSLPLASASLVVSRSTRNNSHLALSVQACMRTSIGEVSFVVILPIKVYPHRGRHYYTAFLLPVRHQARPFSLCVSLWALCTSTFPFAHQQSMRCRKSSSVVDYGKLDRRRQRQYQIR